jgi:uncharacterized membrane protein
MHHSGRTLRLNQPSWLAKVTQVLFGATVVLIVALLVGSIPGRTNGQPLCVGQGCAVTQLSWLSRPLGLPIEVIGLVFWLGILCTIVRGSRRLEVWLWVSGLIGTAVLIWELLFNLQVLCATCLASASLMVVGSLVRSVKSEPLKKDHVAGVVCLGVLGGIVVAISASNRVAQQVGQQAQGIRELGWRVAWDSATQLGPPSEGSPILILASVDCPVCVDTLTTAVARLKNGGKNSYRLRLRPSITVLGDSTTAQLRASAGNLTEFSSILLAARQRRKSVIQMQPTRPVGHPEAKEDAQYFQKAGITVVPMVVSLGAHGLEVRTSLQ